MRRNDARHRGLLDLLVGMLATSCLLASAVTAQAGLVFERLDGKQIQFTGTPRVWCGPWDDQVARPSIHVAMRSPHHGWELSAVRRNLKTGRQIEFPNDFVSTRPRGALLFLFDTAIEASSAEEESSGSMVFSRVSCRLGGVVEFSVDAVLGSEFFNGKRVRVSGTFSGHVSKQP